MAKIPGKDELIVLLHTNNDWLGRALMALNRKQTQDERSAESTHHNNQQGFTTGHAKRGTSMANFYSNRGFLTPKQAAWWRKTLPSGRTRIEMYASQLIKIAKEHQEMLARKREMTLAEHGQEIAQRSLG